MQWFGKAIGGLIGSVLGPVGSLVGIAIGHQLDQQAEARRRRPGTQAVSQLFFEVAFEVMGRVAKADGRVSEAEIQVARQIMQSMKLTPSLTNVAIDCFTRGKEASYPLMARLGALTAQIGERSELARAFVQLQLQAAVGAGVIETDKRELLGRVARALGVSRAELTQIEALVRGLGRQTGGLTAAEAVAAAYRVLGVAANASDDDVKTAYRRLMSQHHPDKLVARGLPESMRAVAEQKTQEVRAAYETIKTQRGLK
ncbi:MAG TPA: co-chaperone DjlA [Gammaproteobacteria bacterium]|jgi:DnaJ like chaperone protein|nr:co-chaperone DjlA [Gammaproteobacteria bacterium]